MAAENDATTAIGDGNLDKTRIRELFKKLDMKMFAAGLEVRIFVVGGAAIALTMNEERVTNDIDAKYEAPYLESLIREIAKEEELPNDWLNNHINTVVSYFRKDECPISLFVGNNLSIEVASPEFVLAMKLAARRQKDIDDVVFLVNQLGITSREELITAIQRYFMADLAAAAYQRQLTEDFIDLIIEEGLLEFPKG